jgi:hypothetical protein
VKTIDTYLLDWNGRRPWAGRDAQDGIEGEALAAFQEGRYEYSFSLALTDDSADAQACEYAWLAQGNNPSGTKARRDRQSMSVGDVVAVDGRAYVCAIAGFDRAPSLDKLLADRIEQSWNRWTEQEVTA